MDFDLERFVAAQQGVYEGVLRELRAGHKVGHWIWFIFPQLAGLGRSETSRFYGIASLDEARAYLDHPVLGPRLRECVSAVLASSGLSADQIFGSLDAMKVRSSMTLFHRAAPDEPLFAEVLERFYGGVADETTDALVGDAGPVTGDR
ncbi:MAG: hypothetical protein K0S97_1913 [Chloroflexota bacterium]|nr:hypothetical protein [Chloroflexota bacterium]